MLNHVTEPRAASTDMRVAEILAELSRTVTAVLDDFHGNAPHGVRRAVADLAVVARSVAEAERRVRHLEHGAGARAPLLFDQAFSEDEQLPRYITAVFSEKILGGVPSVVTVINGTAFGDRLTDTIHFEPGSRYHDIFHLAHAACLGWSPVLRNLLGRKRVSNAAVCELEDSVRAQVVEEAIVSHVFNYLRRHGFTLESGRVDPPFLTEVAELCRGYEVQAQPAECWERAVLASAAIFALLKENKGGRVVVDLLEGDLSYFPCHAPDA